MSGFRFLFRSLLLSCIFLLFRGLLLFGILFLHCKLRVILQDFCREDCVGDIGDHCRVNDGACDEEDLVLCGEGSLIDIDIMLICHGDLRQLLSVGKMIDGDGVGTIA